MVTMNMSGLVDYSDSVQWRFSLYREMIGGRTLVGLSEVDIPGKIWERHSLLKWSYDSELHTEKDYEEESRKGNTKKKLSILEEIEQEVFEATLTYASEDIVHYILGNISERACKPWICKVFPNQS